MTFDKVIVTLNVDAIFKSGAEIKRDSLVTILKQKSILYTFRK
jgi:hypothetical protein